MLYLLASYPKSGNTMVRVFLAHYLRQNDNLNKVGFPLYGSDHYFPFGIPADRSLCAPICRDSAVYAKTHETAEVYFPGGAHRCLYIVRNPLDVAPSWANHMMCTIDHGIDCMSRPTKLKAIEHIFAQEIGSWSENVMGWLTKARIPVRCVRYETLVTDPRRAFKVVLDWLEIPFEAEKFDAAIKFIEFGNLQKLEEKKGFKETRGTHGFFRRGEAGGWLDTLTVQQAQRITEDHKAAMKFLGYLK